ncbi:MAG: hypothetical protein AAFX05_00360 [Planctomycetota bacterium]
MLKFLRRYNKLILVVFGAGLMVVFLLPQAITQLGPNPLNARVFTAGGETFRGKDIRTAYDQLRTLRDIESGAGTGMRLQGPAEGPEHWILLRMEAERLGLIGGENDGQDFLNVLAGRWARSGQIGALPPGEAEQAAFDRLRGGRNAAIISGRKPQDVDQTLAIARGIERLVFDTRLDPLEMSWQEAAVIGKQLYETAVVDLVVMDADELIDDDEPLSEEEIVAQFERFKDMTPDESEFGFGYVQPAAVQLEGVFVDRQRILTAVEVDPIEVNTYWRRNKSEFETIGDTFEAVRTTVEGRLRLQRIETIMADVEEAMRREAFATLRLLDRDGDYRVVPDDWASRRLPMERLVEVANESIATHVELEQPAASLVDATDQWYDESDLRTLPFATVFVGRPGQGLLRMLPQIALSVRELDASSDLGIQTGVLFGPLRDSVGSLAYVRVLDSRTSGAAVSLDDVRIDVERDARAMRSYERLVAEADDLAAQARESGGMGPLLDRFAQLGSAPSIELGARVTREAIRTEEGGLLPAVNFPLVRDTLMDTVAPWSPDIEVADLDYAERYAQVLLPKQRRLVAGVVQARWPVTQELLRQNDGRIVTEANRRVSDLRITQMFSFEAMQGRFDYKSLESDEEEPVDPTAELPADPG